MSLFEELKRRKVVRVLIGYAIAAWAIVQVAATAFPLLHIEERFAAYVLVLAVAGFPVAAMLAWMFDVTPRGVRRTRNGDAQVRTAWPLAYRIAGAILALGLIAAGVFATMKRLDTGTIRSIAVLPFRNLSGDSSQQYFSDGIAEELLNELSRINGLTVVARNSSFSFRDAEEDLAAAQRALNVEALLTGSVRRDRQIVRVSARLIEAATGAQIWTDQYDRPLSGLLEVQNEVTRAIVRALRVRVGEPQTEARGTRNVAALDAYLAGLDRWHARGEADLKEAIAHFQRAIQADPNYAQAHGGLALCWAVLPVFSSTTTARDAASRAKAAARRALEIEPDLPEAHAALSQTALNLDLDVRTAAREAQRAIRLNPNYATAHQWYGEVLLVQRRLPEARQHIERALLLDPFSHAARNIMGFLLAVEGKPAESIAYFRETMRLYPHLPTAQQIMAIIMVGVGRYEEAKQEYASFLPGADGIQAVLDGAIARRDGRAGSPEHRTGIAAMRGIEPQMPATISAMFNAALGLDDRAVSQLAAVVRARNDPSAAYFTNWPGFDRLRSTPEYQAILREIGAI